VIQRDTTTINRPLTLQTKINKQNPPKKKQVPNNGRNLANWSFFVGISFFFFALLEIGWGKSMEGVIGVVEL